MEIVIALAAANGLLLFLLWRCHKSRKLMVHEVATLTEKYKKVENTWSSDKQRWSALHEEQLTNLHDLDSRLQAANAQLKAVEPFLAITDAQQEARQLLERANVAAREAEAQGKLHADQLIQRASQHLSQANSLAAQKIESATASAAKIEDDARQRAAEALALLGRESELRSQIEAFENRINGYDDSYLHPASLLLEGLADHYGHEEAAQALKSARLHTKNMLKGGRAADCDYVETNRKVTAIRFVIMAFNGEVDSILSLVKTDNAGTLRQKIKDSFALVNQHGAAFRNARITSQYLDARLAELDAAARFQQLLKAEQEQQRAIREKMREEAKAQREFEAAQKEAAREEDRARKAYEDAKRKVDAASVEERAALEAKMQALEQALLQAQAKGQRALSMAQKTRSGHCYIISNVGSFGEDVLKIGLTRRLDPQDRINELGDASVPFPFDVHALIYSDDAPKLERTLHETFNEHRLNLINPRKEFFRVSLRSVREKIEHAGHQAEFTLTAAAQEWRESEAIRRGSEEARKAALRSVLAQEEGLDDELSDTISTEKVNPCS
ncbi:MAG TPA: DUF4041 domain-containing protein [Hydrogenophaga sp.]|uniref:DUF4041 domain-containing protein n=1 Tax=Hydrogenophaga sp. TaxID=1904254 RepID=UPI0008D7A14E|nr:DUF4041 domain-containing protein [Hydrogenophaga sp.]OGA73872.1 MAG: hypothetical protein A2X73_23795 [Burkholderiales bacterium GWE1_65_30]OGA91788.1 MAG: hypothetical protein A2X72_07880 [Burkholderiales bacterium GWF1_66_17]HAX20317.1 DUF4041 domain-containing protein [Hydrogenophaga sp.]HBU18911.1 DUF4041 domain-containing protein [Hydrogenophaga sp.]